MDRTKFSRILLPSIIATFLLKGLFFSVLIPWFQNPDEQVHYATIQYQAEPKEKIWGVEIRQNDVNDARDISTYHFSEELIRTAQTLRFDQVKFQSENTPDFSTTATGPGEDAILNDGWKRHVNIYPPDASGSVSWYYSLGAWIERSFADRSIFDRMFAIRSLSVLLGVLVIVLSFLFARKLGLSSKNSSVLAGLVAFQPMFTATSSQINIDIALVLAFTVFLYAGTAILRDCLGWKNGLLALAAAALGILTKGPGIALVAIAYLLLAYSAYLRFHVPPKRYLATLAGCTVILAGITFLVTPAHYLSSITNSGTVSKFDSPLQSVTKYVDKTFRDGEFRKTSDSYWGNFGWLDTRMDSTVLEGIRAIETVAWIGILLVLLSPRGSLPYLPEKRFVVYLIGMTIALQLAIRFYDWRVFDTTKQILIGAPGRYFLPNIAAHMALLSVGLGFFAGDRKRFDLLMQTLLAVMVLLQLYAIFDIIIPRYYL